MQPRRSFPPQKARVAPLTLPKYTLKSRAADARRISTHAPAHTSEAYRYGALLFAPANTDKAIRAPRLLFVPSLHCYAPLSLLSSRRAQAVASTATMPTYGALGITATLSVTDLQSSVSQVIDLKGNEEQRVDAKRIADLLSSGTPLVEQLIEADGKNWSHHHLGERDKTPLLVVLAGAEIAPGGVAETAAQKTEKEDAQASTVQLSQQTDSHPTLSMPPNSPGVLEAAWSVRGVRKC